MRFKQSATPANKVTGVRLGEAGIVLEALKRKRGWNDADAIRWCINAGAAVAIGDKRTILLLTAEYQASAATHAANAKR